MSLPAVQPISHPSDGKAGLLISDEGLGLFAGLGYCSW